LKPTSPWPSSLSTSVAETADVADCGRSLVTAGPAAGATTTLGLRTPARWNWVRRPTVGVCGGDEDADTEDDGEDSESSPADSAEETDLGMAGMVVSVKWSGGSNGQEFPDFIFRPSWLAFSSIEVHDQ
jgi:hypothetical protein